MSPKNNKGFTLLELLIVIVIISVLALAVLFVLNPAETLRKTRDAQRFADMGTLKNTISIYISTKNTPYLGGISSNTACKTGANGGSYGAGSKIFYSVEDDTLTLTDATLDGGSGSVPAPAQATSSETNASVNGSGWVPVELSSISGGSPISNLPIDPTNSISSGSSITNADKVYRYACNSDGLTFELNAVLESTAFTVDDNKMTKDGGNNPNYYEIGTNLLILGAGTDF